VDAAGWPGAELNAGVSGGVPAGFPEVLDRGPLPTMLVRMSLQEHWAQCCCKRVSIISK
jgi:hypothetical protein